MRCTRGLDEAGMTAGAPAREGEASRRAPKRSACCAEACAASRWRAWSCMQTLDVALGLVFVYLLLSLACTAANELLSQWFNSRATTLRQGIDALLRDVVDVTSPESLAALTQQRTTATTALREAERLLRAAAPPAFDGWAAAVHALDEAELIHDEVCARARAVRQGDTHQAAVGALELIGQTSDIAVGRARSQLDDARTGRSDAERVLRLAEPLRFAALLELRETAAKATADERLATVYDHPLIAGLSQLPWRLLPWDTKVRLPSYIPTQTFVHALMDQIAPAASGSPTPLLEVRRALAGMPPHVQRPLLLALNESAGDVETFRATLGTWYDNTMERVSGLYKRKTKLTVLMFAVAVTLFTNADTIRIVRAISSNKVLRETLVAQADGAAGNASSDSLRASFSQSIADMQALGIPMGYAMPDSVRQLLPVAAWFGETRARVGKRAGDTTTRAVPSRTTLYLAVYLPQLRSGLVGLLLTALAISLGAPFWFDILNKIVNVRAVGRTPAENAKARAAATANTDASR